MSKTARQANGARHTPLMTDVTDAAVKDALRQACELVGLPRAYAPLVGRMLDTPAAEWPECCGEGCTPCSQTLADAATYARELLGRTPSGQG